MDEAQYLAELDSCVSKILESTAQRKLILAGPGTGKTFFFKKLLTKLGGQKNKYLVVTFINELVKDLEKELGELSEVHTFHGYCHKLLRDNPKLLMGLRDEFFYYPPIASIAKRDWEILKKSTSPNFTNLMRALQTGDELDFFIERANYYNAVGFEDSIIRVFLSIKESSKSPTAPAQTIVDEYQDFNKLETNTLKQLIQDGCVLIAGDDDQALYCVLRGSDPTFIRELYASEDFEKFELPFCLRCPKPVIEVFKSIVENAKQNGFLTARIKKRFDFFPPKKGRDSTMYPTVKIVKTTIQKKSILTNYFGRYILQEIPNIPTGEIEESHKDGFPTVLIIGPKHYLESIAPILDQADLEYEIRGKAGRKDEMELTLEDAIGILKKDKESNLGWRIILEIYKDKIPKEVMTDVIIDSRKIKDSLPEEIRNEILGKIELFTEVPEVPETKEVDTSKPRIKLTTYEGSKGLSAQHVFIVGFQNGILPQNQRDIGEIEICKLLVALTRTRKQCHILTTKNFAGRWVEPSIFMEWLGKDYVSEIDINKNYWKK